MTEADDKHLRNLLRHIENVSSSCLLLGERLIEQGEDRLGLELISNGHTHDHSKFFGIEWDYLRDKYKNSEDNVEKCFFTLAMSQHQKTNLHHPEAWENGVKGMPDVYIAEMVCDWKARSNEFATGLRDWVKDKATKRWKFTVQSKEYKTIKKFVDLLLDPQFKDS